MRRSFARAAEFAVLGLLWCAAGVTIPAYGQAIEMGQFVTTYTQDFNSLPTTTSTAVVTVRLGEDAFIPDGWTVHRSKSGTTININNGSSNTGGLYSYGHTSSTDRALGGITADTPGEFTYNLLLHNTSGRTITALDIAFAAEQWRVGSINTDVQRLLFTYAIAEYPSSFNQTVKLGTPGWTTVPSLQFNSPVIKRKAGHVDGNAPENRKEFTYTLPEAIPDGYYVMLRWYDPDELEQDHGLAIDDVKVSWHFMQQYIPLPVELTKFTAQTTGRAVQLAWTTASEQDSKHFEVERSADGKSFEAIGIVAAQGSTSLVTNYTFHDMSPLSGVAYYRLKQVDEDGTYTYSKTVAVRTTPTVTASLYPTVASHDLKLGVPHARSAYQIVVYDQLGSAVLQQHVSGSGTYTLNVSNLRHGSYVLVLLDEAGQKQSLRFLKK